MILAITGHRPNKLGGYIIPNPVANAVMAKLHDSLKILRPETVLSGMALGVDQWTAQICIEMSIPFKAIIAFPGYESKWPPQSQKWYRHLISKAVEVHMLHPGPYEPALLHQRNYWMVDHSDALLAVWDGLPGSGTASCVQYAQLKNPPKPAYRLDLPEELWAIAKGEEDVIRTRRDAWKSSEASKQVWKAPTPPKQEVKVSNPFLRFVEVGEEEP